MVADANRDRFAPTHLSLGLPVADRGFGGDGGALAQQVALADRHVRQTLLDLGGRLARTQHARVDEARVGQAQRAQTLARHARLVRSFTHNTRRHSPGS